MTGATTSIRVEQVEETPVEDVKAPVAAVDIGSAGAMTTTDGVELRFMISSSAVEVRSAPLAPLGAPLRSARRL